MRCFQSIILMTILLLCSLFCYAQNYDGFLPPGKKPVKVGVGIFLNNVDFISEHESSVQIVMTIYSTWEDPRLKFTPKEDNEVKVYTGEAASDLLKTIWHPYLDVPQREDVNNIQQYLLRVHSDGRVTSFKKEELDLDLNSDVRKFPFDKQTAIISILPFGYNKSQVELYKLTEFEGISPGIIIPNWKLYQSYESKIVNFSHISDITPHSSYEFILHFKRLSYPYVVQVLLPLFVISVMCYLMMFTPIPIGDMFAVLITIILAMIAFQWLVIGQVPSGPYLNYTEIIILISFMFCCSVMISCSVFEIVEKKMSKVVRRRIEICMRIFLALIYIILNLAVLYHFFK